MHSWHTSRHGITIHCTPKPYIAILTPTHVALCVGPLFGVSMFNGESIWGQVLVFARNRKEPEATMMHAISDICAVQQATANLRKLGLQLDPQFTTQPWAPKEEWAPEDSVLDSSIAASAQGCIPLGRSYFITLTFTEQAKLHAMYLRQYGPQHRYTVLWGRFLEVVSCRPANERLNTNAHAAAKTVTFNTPVALRTHLMLFIAWARAQSLSVDDRRMAQGFSDVCTTFKKVKIGSLQVEIGSWFLARPSMLSAQEQASMWFGHVEDLISHKGPDGNTGVFVKVGNRHVLVMSWHNVSVIFIGWAIKVGRPI